MLSSVNLCCQVTMDNIICCTKLCECSCIIWAKAEIKKVCSIQDLSITLSPGQKKEIYFTSTHSSLVGRYSNTCKYFSLDRQQKVRWKRTNNAKDKYLFSVFLLTISTRNQPDSSTNDRHLRAWQSEWLASYFQLWYNFPTVMPTPREVLVHITIAVGVSSGIQDLGCGLCCG